MAVGWYQGRAREAPALGGGCLACGCANRGQIRPGPFSAGEAEAVMGERAARGTRRGWGGWGAGSGGGERRLCKAVGEGGRKGEHGCRELLVVSEAEGQAGWLFLRYQELPAGKPHATQRGEEQAPRLSLARIDRHPL